MKTQARTLEENYSKSQEKELKFKKENLDPRAEIELSAMQRLVKPLVKISPTPRPPFISMENSNWIAQSDDFSYMNHYSLQVNTGRVTFESWNDDDYHPNPPGSFH